MNRDINPPIVLTRADYQRLSSLARAALRTSPDVADFLLGELDRAAVVEAGPAPGDVITMGSEVSYREERSGDIRRVRLVYPHEADLAAGRVSVMTPVGAALIGLQPGQSMTWQSGGEEGRVTVLEVVPDRRPPTNS